MVTGSFGAFVDAASRAGNLVVQPRMGFDHPHRMRAGLLATKRLATRPTGPAAPPVTVGTITLDSYTRTNDHAAARRALDRGLDLNGFPLVTIGPVETREMLRGVSGPDFPVQVRHGAAAPLDIFGTLIMAGIEATEGGPVSYCLPYSRTPLAEAVANWAECCQVFAQLRERGAEPHLETFGGCMLGQLCPPSLLVALSILEGLFFHQYGIRSISLSYAQQTNRAQDEEAVAALRCLAGELLGDTQWHVVLYTYMGVYPRTEVGARRVLVDAARLAVRSGADRLIVKTAVEAYRIPTVEENLVALRTAATAAAAARHEVNSGEIADTGILAEARSLVEAVLNLAPDLGTALTKAFQRGYLDVPWCLHPSNAGRTRSYLDAQGRLLWSDIGSLPIGAVLGRRRAPDLSSGGLMRALSYMEQKYDADAIDGARRPLVAGYHRARQLSSSRPSIEVGAVE